MAVTYFNNTYNVRRAGYFTPSPLPSPKSSFELTPPGYIDTDNIAMGGSGSARYWADTYSFDSSFGILGGYFGPLIREALQTPLDRGNRTTVGGIGIDNTLLEKANTFGTNEYFRALGRDYLYANTSQADKLKAAHTLANINPMYNQLPILQNERSQVYSTEQKLFGGVAGKNVTTEKSKVISMNSKGRATDRTTDTSTPYFLTDTLSPLLPALNGQNYVLPNGKQFNDAGVEVVRNLQMFQTFLGGDKGDMAGPVHSITATPNPSYIPPVTPTSSKSSSRTQGALDSYASRYNMPSYGATSSPSYDRSQVYMISAPKTGSYTSVSSTAYMTSQRYTIGR